MSKKTIPEKLIDHFSRAGRMLIGGVPQGMSAWVLADLARSLHPFEASRPQTLAVVLSDTRKVQQLRAGLEFFAPDLEVMNFPAWDCVPYDRVSPSPAVLGERVTALARLSRMTGGAKPRIFITTAHALTQKVPAKAIMARDSLALRAGQALDSSEFVRWLEANGYMRTGTVRECGEYALRGGLIDLFPPTFAEPVRLDFFGATLESIRAFDGESQRSTISLRALELVPSSELMLHTETIRRFRQGYATRFGGNNAGDKLYEAISEGRRAAGAEHWLPLFYPAMDTLFDYLGATPLVMDEGVESAIEERFDDIADHYTARKQAYTQEGASCSYKPLEPEALYLSSDEWQAALRQRASACLMPHTAGGAHVLDLGGRISRNFAAERTAGASGEAGASLYDAVSAHVKSKTAEGKRVLFAAWTEGSRQRLQHVFDDHGMKGLRSVGSLREALEQPPTTPTIALLGLEGGFETDQLCVLSEEDILGERYSSSKRRTRRTHDALLELQNLSVGDLVVHVDHGIGRFVGLQTLTAAGASHDCIELHYAGGDKLFLPVENIDLITRYGSEDTAASLDRLGSGGWQQRKAKFKQRIREMAQDLVRIAAERHLREAPRLPVPDGLYDEFCARFPYDETDDQLSAIDAVLDDLNKGRPMDRLICGDVGFGKTEVALRAAFAAVMNGKQVAVVVPTTLLARQHYNTFVTRFRDVPIKIAQASRLVSAADLKATKEGLTNGSVDLVVGTHALLGKGIQFKDLGLMIIDEEQHFGVTHKERLKQLAATVHVLTLTATPIPRTLQLAMTGIRDMSLIATPPVDRMSVRTSVMPFDGLLVREALMRERHRGGQSFFVCPRIDDLAEARRYLEKEVPELSIITAHGQMPASDIEEKITAFYEGKADVLLSTTIVESGLDIPTANTLIVHRADMFGLSQLYQLRGRVGRSKQRAYALLTLPENGKMTAGAQKRLEVLQSLDSLGAGFQLASHDLDMRGAGNLLGDEQSGHIKEVGFELYQQMLEEAIEMLKTGAVLPMGDRWSPQINLGASILIPEDYVPDLDLRLALYRRLANLDQEHEIESFAAEMVDRFGKLPLEAEHLLKTASIKAQCRQANIEKLEAGPKGLLVAFRDNAFANPAGLVKLIAAEGANAKVRPDMKIFFMRDFNKLEQRLKGTISILTKLVSTAKE